MFIAMSNAPATNDIPKNPAIRREWISFQLRIRGLSYRAIARREGVSHQAVSVSAGGLGSSHLQEVLATAIDLGPQQLFPELYDARGNRLGRTLQPNRTTRRDGGNGKDEEAA
mgnify:FL=1